MKRKLLLRNRVNLVVNKGVDTPIQLLRSKGQHTKVPAEPKSIRTNMAATRKSKERLPTWLSSFVDVIEETEAIRLMERQEPSPARPSELLQYLSRLTVAVSVKYADHHFTNIIFYNCTEHYFQNSFSFNVRASFFVVVGI